MGQHDFSRRDFFRCACSATAMAVLGTQLAGCDSADPNGGDGGPDPGPGPGSGVTIDGNRITLDLNASSLSELKEEGGFVLIATASTLALNEDGTTIRALSSTCTHMACTVDSFANGRLTCPCHGSQYSPGGSVLRGPATAPLEEYAVTRTGDTVVITKG